MSLLTSVSSRITAGDVFTFERTFSMEGFKRVSLELIYRNQYGKEVLVGSSYGIIRDNI